MKAMLVMGTAIATVAKNGIRTVLGDVNAPISLQLRFWGKQRRERFKEEVTKLASRVRGLTVDNIDDFTIHIQLVKDGMKADALIVPIGQYISTKFPIEQFDVFLVILAGKRDKREKLSKILHKHGMRRGWLKQVFIKRLDELIASHGLRFELLSLVYELRMYKGRVFTAAGTANFWPKGIGSIKEALEEYLLPIEEARGYYIFIKSLRFRIMKDREGVGTYSIDRWGKVTIAPRSDVDTILEVLPIMVENILNNYVEYKLHYSVRVDRVRNYTAYYLEEANSIYFSAVEPGPGFFNMVKLIVSKPIIWDNKLIILPVEIGNPRLVSRIIDKQTGMAVTLIATYNGIRLLPAPGSTRIDAEMIDHVLAMFRNLVSE